MLIVLWWCDTCSAVNLSVLNWCSLAWCMLILKIVFHGKYISLSVVWGMYFWLAWDWSHQPFAPLTSCTVRVRVKGKKGSSSRLFIAQCSVFCNFAASGGENQTQYGFTGFSVVVLSLCNGIRESKRLRWKCELGWAWHRKNAHEEFRIRESFKGEWRVQ